MATKNNIKQFLGKLKRVKTWQLFLILLPLLFLSATFLRLDHQGMIDRREAVLKADEEGTDEDIAAALRRLQQYTSTHIVINIVEHNGMSEVVFGTAPFYLENQYIKKATAALEDARSNFDGDDNPNGNIFDLAAAVCDPPAQREKWPWARYRDCFLAEIAKYPASEAIDDLQQALIPSTALYRHDFASPVWYPNLAGLSVLLCAVILVVIITKLLMSLFLRIALIFIKNK